MRGLEISRRREEAAAYRIPIVPFTRAGRAGRYLLCEPNGDAVVPGEDGERVIGNFFADLDGVAVAWYEQAAL